MTFQADAASLEPAAPSAVQAQLQAPALLHRVLVFPLKFFWGMLFCQSLAGSIFVVGWTYRLAQRSALKFWFSRRGRPQASLAFAEFAAAQEVTSEHVHWPNWFVQQNFRHAVRSGPEAGWITAALNVLRALVHSLWVNFWTGLSAIANTWVLTLPAGVFWWFGWYDGWNNSFNKGYEQAAVGPLISLFGIAWFITAMLHLPLAQARQAITGQWRSFYEFRLIRKLVRDRWVSCVLLAVSYSLLCVPLSILKTSPMFWMHSNPALGALTTAQVAASLKGYFFWCALVMLPAFVVLRLAAVRVYASGLLSLVQRGRIAASELSPNERTTLDRLGLLAVQAEPERHVLVRFVSWTGTRLGRVVGGVVLTLVWFSFVAQIYITEFLNYHSGAGWLNQPLVQLPWFCYLPTSVRNPMGDVFSALLVLLVALLVRSILRGFRRVS